MEVRCEKMSRMLNPSYDGAPACGNCRYKFPKMKPYAPKKEIFDKAPEKKKKQFSDRKKVQLKSLKENKVLIGAIMLITIIVICRCHHRTKQ